MSDTIIDTKGKGAGKALRMLCMNFCIAFTTLILMSTILGMIFADEQAKQGISTTEPSQGLCLVR